MALLKIVNIGDELVFDMDKTEHKRISIKVSEKTGRAVALVIRADRSIPISHIKHTDVSGVLVDHGTVTDIEDKAEVQRFLGGNPAPV